MKKTITRLAIAAACSCTAIFCQAQTSKTPEWISEKGYWVVETNQKTPKTSTVYCYTPNHELFYKEEVVGTRLSLKKHKVRMQLKQVLETAYTAWQTRQQPAAETLVATALRSRRLR